MTHLEYEDLFSEDWREPGDEAMRWMVYIVMALGSLAGIGCVVYGLQVLRDPTLLLSEGVIPQPGWRSWAEGFGAVAIAVGATMTIGALLFFLKEKRHWNLRGMTAERFVAGGMLFGVAIILFGLELHDAPPVAFVVALAGGAVMVVFLFIGLICAYVPVIKNRPRAREGVTVEARFALDETYEERWDHPCPWEEGWTAVLRLRFKDGTERLMPCTDEAYDLADPGRRGTAVIAGKVVRSFSPRAFEP